MLLLFAQLDSERKARELAQRTAALDRRVFERNAILGGSLLLFALAAAGWVMVLTRRRAHKKLQDAFGSLQASNAQLVARETELRLAWSRIKRLEGLIPICASCKCVRDDGGDWQQVEKYIIDHADVSFTHGYCPSCAQAALDDSIIVPHQQQHTDGEGTAPDLTQTPPPAAEANRIKSDE